MKKKIKNLSVSYPAGRAAPRSPPLRGPPRRFSPCGRSPFSLETRSPSRGRPAPPRPRPRPPRPRPAAPSVLVAAEIIINLRIGMPILTNWSSGWLDRLGGLHRLFLLLLGGDLRHLLDELSWVVILCKLSIFYNVFWAEYIAYEYCAISHREDKIIIRRSSSSTTHHRRRRMEDRTCW